MSISPVARQAVESKSIPIRHVSIKDHSELPSHYSSTPGGTLFSTTPGGTKIVYDKSFLMNLRNSPISKTPPNFDIPEHLAIGSPTRHVKYEGGSHKPRYNRGPQKINSPARTQNPPKITESAEDQFQIDI